MMKSRLVVLDTNCLIQILGIHSKYRFLWSAFMTSGYVLCISNEILHEYEEILSQKASPLVADMFLKVLARSRNVIRKDPYFRFNLIEKDKDDNKFVDCAICANAKYIVSEDHHFDVLKKCSFPKVEIVGIDLFANILKTRPYSALDEDSPMLLNEDMAEYSSNRSESNS